MNLIEEIALRHDPGTIAIVSGETRASYGDLFSEARRLSLIHI